MDFSGLLIKMIIFMVLLILGYWAARKNYLGREFARSASWLLVNVFLTASIFSSVTGARPDLPPKELWFAFFVFVLLFVLLYACATIVARFDAKETAPQTVLLLATVNTLFVGIPVVQVLCGSEAVFYLGLSCIPFNVILYTYGIWLLKKGHGEKGVRWKDMLTAPLVAAVISLLIFVFNIRLPRVITELFSTVSGGTVPVSMLVIGATLGSVSLKDAFCNKKLYLLSLIRLIVMPVAVYFLFRLFVSNQVVLLCTVVIAACPAATLCTPVSMQCGYDPRYTSEGIMLTTALSMITLPALLVVFF